MTCSANHVDDKLMTSIPIACAANGRLLCEWTLRSLIYCVLIDFIATNQWPVWTVTAIRGALTINVYLY